MGKEKVIFEGSLMDGVRGDLPSLCEDASSHKEAAEWMLHELTTKGNEVYDAGYFKNGTLEVIK